MDRRALQVGRSIRNPSALNCVARVSHHASITLTAYLLYMFAKVETGPGEKENGYATARA
jgi:hypothetical protein